MKDRFEYIDAMRGAVMILVVMWHVKLYSIHLYGTFSFNDVFFLIMMPAFFFISGYVGSERWKSWKYLPMLLPSVFFMLLWGAQAGWSIHSLFFDVSKGGFWFTLLLPFYFVIYAFSRLILTKGLKVSEKAFNITHILLGILIYLGTAFVVSPFNPLKNDTLNGLLSVVHFRYYLFFAIGITAASNREFYLHWSKDSRITTAMLCLFFAACIAYFKTDDKLWQTLLLPFIGFSGTQILFTFFYRNRKTFSRETRAGKTLQYVGIRTLDIYLLHLFFLPLCLNFIGEFFFKYPNPFLEVIVSFLIASVVVAGCLIASKLIRTSDILAKLLFGKVIKEQ